MLTRCGGINSKIFSYVAAEDRRRNSTGYVIGISEVRLQKYVIPRLRAIYGIHAYVSASTLRRLGEAPKKNCRAHKRYRGIMKFKRAPMSYSKFKETKNLHFSAAQVRTVAEVSTFFRDEIVFLSCDNKQKVQTGRPANSAYRRPTGLYLVSLRPDLDDHSFPIERLAQLVPMGYMFVDQFVERQFGRCRHSSISHMPKMGVLIERKRSFSEPSAVVQGNFTFRVDPYGRRLIRTLRRGHLEVYVTVDRFLTSSSTRHINHLLEIYNKEKERIVGRKNLHILADNGPDWKFGPGTVFDYGRLWMALNLDSLVIVHYAPYCSKLNYIERLWPQLTHATKTVTLPITLPGHVLPPSRMTWLSKQERLEKLKEVLMRASAILCRIYEYVFTFYLHT